jgi:hypothetical protein
MALRREDTRGWIGSLILHVIIGAAFFFWNLDVTVSEPEFIEVSWGSVANISTSTPARPLLAGTEGRAAAPLLKQSRAMDLPERTFNTDRDVIQVPAGKKLEVDDRPVASRVAAVENSRGGKDQVGGIGSGAKEKFTTPGKGESTGDLADPLATGTAGTDVGKSVSVSMQWNDGGTRKKISGALPAYPDGVNVEAQIKIELTVVPDGTVKSLRPVQKANTRLEEAAMKEVRLWKFEPLRKSSPQRDQTGMVTFNFQLR